MRVALTGHRPQRLGLPEDESDIAWKKIEEWIIEQLFKMNEVSYLNEKIWKFIVVWLLEAILYLEL